MAILKAHGGIESIRIGPRSGHKYAICLDGKVLHNSGFGWTIANYDLKIVSGWLVDESSQAKAIITRANADSHAHEAAKKMRRVRR